MDDGERPRRSTAEDDPYSDVSLFDSKHLDQLANALQVVQASATEADLYAKQYQHELAVERRVHKSIREQVVALDHDLKVKQQELAVERIRRRDAIVAVDDWQHKHGNLERQLQNANEQLEVEKKEQLEIKDRLGQEQESSKWALQLARREHHELDDKAKDLEGRINDQIKDMTRMRADHDQTVRQLREAEQTNLAVQRALDKERQEHNVTKGKLAKASTQSSKQEQLHASMGQTLLNEKQKHKRVQDELDTVTAAKKELQTQHQQTLKQIEDNQRAVNDAQQQVKHLIETNRHVELRCSEAERQSRKFEESYQAERRAYVTERELVEREAAAHRATTAALEQAREEIRRYERTHQASTTERGLREREVNAHRTTTETLERVREQIRILQDEHRQANALRERAETMHRELREAVERRLIGKHLWERKGRQWREVRINSILTR